MVNQAQMDSRVKWGQLDQLDNPELVDLTGPKVTWVSLAMLGHRGKLVVLGLEGTADLKDPQDRMERKGNLGQVGSKGPLEIRVLRALLAPQEIQDNKALPERKVHKAIEAAPEAPGPLETSEPLDSLETPEAVDRTERQERRALLGQLDLWGPLVSQGHRVVGGHPVSQVRQVHLDRRVKLGLLDQQV
jgi:hypothetical protein